MRWRWILLFLVGACQCDEQTDEERLRERIDTTSVHLYVASKVALTKADDDPVVGAARVQLMEAIGRVQALRHGAPPAPGKAPTGNSPSDGTRIRAEDAAALVRALVELRAIGRDIVRSDSEDELEPMLPVLLTLLGKPEMASRIDINTEHAILTLAFVALKFDERSPAPIPMEILLYEAYRTDPARIGYPGLEPLVRSVKAWIYGQNDFCDLAKVESDALAAGDPTDRQRLLGAALQDLGAGPLDGAELIKLEAATRGVAHGETAVCYFARDDAEAARPELARFCDAAEEFGIERAELALLRAYLAYHDGDVAETRDYLRQAKASTRIDDDERAEIDRLIAYLDRDDRGAFDGYFDRAFFATVVARLLISEIGNSGLMDKAKESPMLDAASRFGMVTGQVIGAARDAVGDLTEQAKSFWDGC